MKKILNQFGSKTLIRKEGGSLVQQEHIKSRITVLPEFESLIPALLPEEYSQLEANILKDGCREPLLIWQTTNGNSGNSDADTPLFVLIDGHNRFSICQRHGLEFNIAVRDFATKEQVRDFMIDNQLGRRNLTAEQMSYLRGLKYMLLKKKQGRPESVEGTEGSSTITHLGQQITDVPRRDGAGSLPSSVGKRTDEKLAEVYNVSSKTIRLDADFAKGADRLSDQLKNEVLSRQSKIRKSDVVRLGTLPPLAKPIESREELLAVLKSSMIQPDHRATPALQLPEGPDYWISKIKALANQLESESPAVERLARELLVVTNQLLAYRKDRS